MFDDWMPIINKYNAEYYIQVLSTVTGLEINILNRIS